MNLVIAEGIESNHVPQTGSTCGNSSPRGVALEVVVALAMEVVVEVDKILSLMLLRIHLYAIPLV